MPKRIVGVADLNIPGPDTRTLVAQLKALSDGKRPITTDELAKVLKCSVGKIEYTLNIASQVGLVKRVRQGWIAT
jgi:predicted transcriptional regulator